MAYITVEHLSKTYRIARAAQQGTSFRELLVGGMSNAFNRLRGKESNAASFEQVQALNDVSFSLDKGDVLGIIGTNGSGKSTLLKILSRITLPSAGRVELGGRVASLLEVGTGFHQELTGRENIFMNGVILGMSRAEVQRRFDQIVDFSGVEKFLDTPVKRYSSGMLLRLAFSVAAHLDPEILIVDEVLAVGDHQFQKKCMQVMDDLGATGRTILFVSHNLGAVRKLCNKGLLLNKGNLLEQGSVGRVIDAYLMQNSGSRSCMAWTEQTAPRDTVVRLRQVRVLDKAGQSKETFSIHEPLSVEVDYDVFKDDRVLSVALIFYSRAGMPSFMTLDTASTEYKGKNRHAGSYKSICQVPRDFLNDGEIYVSVMIVESGSTCRLREENVISFKVNDDMAFVGARGDFIQRWPACAVRPEMVWHVEHTE